ISSLRSADSKRKQGWPLSILAKAETGVSTSATRSTINGTRLPRFASARNVSRVGEIECSSFEVMTANLASVRLCVTLPEFAVAQKADCAIISVPFDAGVAQW